MDKITSFLIELLEQSGTQRNVDSLHKHLSRIGIVVSPSVIKKKLQTEPYFEMGKTNYYKLTDNYEDYISDSYDCDEDDPVEFVPYYDKQSKRDYEDKIDIGIHDNPSLKIKNEFWFDSILLPRKAFQKSADYSDYCHNRKYKVILNNSNKRTNIPEKIIYSLSLKLLNRGFVLPASSIVSESLAEAFNETKRNTEKQSHAKANTNLSFDLQLTNEQNQYIDSVIKPLFGNSWDEYVTVRKSVADILGNQAKLHHKGKYVDFYIEYGDKCIAICFDDNELENAYNIFEFRDVYVLSGKDTDSLNRILSVSKTPEDEKSIEITKENVLQAFKLEHQLSTAILKALEKGYIYSPCNIQIRYNFTDLPDSITDGILKASIDEIYQVTDNYKKIYDLDSELRLNDEKGSRVSISIGSIQNDADISILSVENDNDFCADIDSFSLDYLPQVIDIKSLRFFLKYIFDFDSFQDGQEKALRNLLLGIDSIVLLPTGAGKSLIFQLASYILPGLVVVISPLRALINDQTANLDKRHGINLAGRYMREESDGVDLNEVTDILLKYNSTSLLYVAPERMQIPKFRDTVKELLKKNNVCAVAIDEAHCISEWGHDFRPSYLNIGRVSRDIFSKGEFTPTLIALTGTASNNVLNDVKNELEITGLDSMIVPESFDRKELKYSVIQCSGNEKIDNLEEILRDRLPESFDISYKDFAFGKKGKHFPGIIFTPYANPKRESQYGAFYVYKELSERFSDMTIKPYFTGSSKNRPINPDTEEKYTEQEWDSTLKETATQFKDDSLNLLVATKAYGMGIDKGNIRYIIHNGLPSSIEQYYQEAGRAGRDREETQCILLFSNDYPDYNEKMLSPSLTLDDFNSEKSAHKSNPDDLQAMLFFHGESFRGVEEETKYFEKIIVKLKEHFSSGKNFKVGLYSLKPEDEKIAKDKELMRAMIRFQILGIISDYTYDYSSRQFTITPGSVKKSDIIQKYYDYISKNNVEAANVAVNKLKSNLMSEWTFVEYSLKLLVVYIYDNIEKSRRAALRGMFELARDASRLPVRSRDGFIRKQILNYLQVDAQTQDRIEDLLSAGNGGFNGIESFFEFSMSYETPTRKEKEKANVLRGRIGRYIESYADHPGLLLLRELTSIKSGKYSTDLSAAGLSSAFVFASERYGVSESVIEEYLAKVSNYILTVSWELFESFKYEIDDNNLLYEDLIDLLLKSEYISSENRDYLLLQYFKEELFERVK